MMPLPPARALKDGTARYLVAARHHVREIGRDVAIECLRASVKPLTSPFEIMRWPDGTRSTGPAFPDGRGRGELRAWPSFAEFTLAMAEYSVNVVPKKMGKVIAYGASGNGRRRDEDCLRITAILFDCDDMGDWEPLCSVLASVDLSYYAALRQETRKFHLIPPLSTPIIPPAEFSSEYKLEHRRRVGWVLGVFSEIADLACRSTWPMKSNHFGFDTATDALLNLEFPVTRRAPDEAVPEIRSHIGGGLDFERLLELSGYHEFRERHVREKRARSEAAPKQPRARGEAARKHASHWAAEPFECDEPWWRAFVAAGWVGERLAENKFHAVCPFASMHSGLSSPTSTVIFTDRRPAHLHCSHGSCTNRRTPAGLYAAMPQKARLILDEAFPTPALTRLRKQLADALPKNDVVVMKQPDVAPYIAHLIREWRPGSIVVVQVPCGSGKSHGVRIAAATATRAPLAKRIVMGCPSHRLAEEQVAKLPTGSQFRKGVLSVLDVNGKPVCVQFERARRWQRERGAVTKAFCSVCEERYACAARQRDDGSPLVVTVHQLVSPIAAQIAKHKKQRGPVVRVCDESPELTRNDRTSRADVEALGTLIEAERTARLERRASDVRLTLQALLALRPLHTILSFLLREELNARDIDVPVVLELIAETLSAHASWRELLEGAEIAACSKLEKGRFLHDHRRASRFRKLTQRYGQSALGRLRAAIAMAMKPLTCGMKALVQTHERRGGLINVTDDVFAQHLKLQAVLPRVREVVLGANLWFDGDGIAVTVLTPEAASLEKTGGVLLDATPDVGVLRARFPQMEFHALHTPDAVQIDRVVALTSGATRRGLTPTPHGWREFGEMVRQAFEVMPGARRVLIIGYKALIVAIEGGKHPEELKQLFDYWRGGMSGRELDFAYYGNVRGFDEWKDFDGFITVGDPRNDITEDAKIAIAHGLDQDEYIRDSAARELAQAHGRARDPSRTSPAVHVHVGTIAPIGWHANNTDVLRSFAGRPRRTTVMSLEELRRIVDALGGWEQAARAASDPASDKPLHRTTVWRWSTGETVVPRDAAERLRAAMREATAEANGDHDEAEAAE